MKRSEKQILITGCYRSGTEYITQLMGNHPQLSVSMYVVSFLRFCYGRYDDIKEKMNYTKLIFDAGKRIRIRWNRKLNVNTILDYCDQCNEVTYALLYDLVMCDLFLNKDVNQWAEKTQLVWTKVPAFLEMFPQGKTVIIIRDPRSTLASFKNFTYAPESAYLGAIFNCYDVMKKGLRYVSQYGNNRVHLIKYEDVIASPEQTLKSLFNFLELSSDHDFLSRNDWKDVHGNPWVHNSVFMQSDSENKNFDKWESINRWKKNLSKEDIALCEEISGELMKLYGYELSEIKIPWNKMIAGILHDTTLTNYLKKWIFHREGVEVFPTDPLDLNNWAENVLINK